MHAGRVIYRDNSRGKCANDFINFGRAKRPESAETGTGFEAICSWFGSGG